MEQTLSMYIRSDVHTEFEWDPAKAETNFKKHGVTFTDAARALRRGVVLERVARWGEERWLAVGPVGQLEVTIIFTYRHDKIRIISTRRARPRERRQYRAHFGR